MYYMISPHFFSEYILVWQWWLGCHWQWYIILHSEVQCKFNDSSLWNFLYSLFFLVHWAFLWNHSRYIYICILIVLIYLHFTGRYFFFLLGIWWICRWGWFGSFLWSYPWSEWKGSHWIMGWGLLYLQQLILAS